MFNFSVLLTVATLLLVESYKLISLKLRLTTTPTSRSSNTSIFFPIQLTVLTILYNQFFNTTIATSSTNVQLLLVLFSIYFFWFIKYESTTILLICWILTNLFSSTPNIVVFVFMAEFLSFITFFFLFFNVSKTHTSRTTPIIYFILLNILTLMWGLLLVIVTLYTHGTTSINLLAAQVTLHPIVTLALIVYVTLKLGQGPAIFFKFRFYRILNLYDLILYLCVYLTYVWPVLFYLINSLASGLFLWHHYFILFLPTVFLLLSLTTYSSIWDFLVFSTWVFIWYALLLTL